MNRFGEEKSSHGGGIVVRDYTNWREGDPPVYKTVAQCEAEDIKRARNKFGGR